MSLSLVDVLPILEQPVRHCGMAHENIASCSASGRPQKFVEQCPLAGQHAGCPHFLEQAFEEGRFESIAHAALAAANPELAERLMNLVHESANLDHQIRVARTDAADENELSKHQHVPAMTKRRRERIEGILERYNETLASLEEIRGEVAMCLRQTMY